MVESATNKKKKYSMENFHQEVRENKQKGPACIQKSIAARQIWQQQQNKIQLH